MTAYASGTLIPQEDASYYPVLASLEARRALTVLEWRIIRHLAAGMSDAWICETLACRPGDITRARHQAAPWRGVAS